MEPSSFEQVLYEESQALHPEPGNAQKRALCLSGGGIRSATFGLGVLQGLAEHGLLDRFDYLSTVSGGGYIGGWLVAWAHRARGIHNVLPQLRPDIQPEPKPIAHLRAYNNYLTPRLGPLSLDAWTAAATVLRNLFFNWLVFVPLLLGAVAAPRLLLALTCAVSPSPMLLALGLALLALGAGAGLRYLPDVGAIEVSPAKFCAWVLTPWVLAVLVLTLEVRLHWWPALGAPARLTLGPPLLLLALGAAGALFAAFSSHRLRNPDREWMARAGAYLLLVAALWVAAGATALLSPAWARAVSASWNRYWAAGGLAAVTGLCGWAGSLAGYWDDVAGKRFPLRSVLVKIAPALFLVLLAAGLSLLSDVWLPLSAAASRGALALMACLAFSALMAFYVNVNKFSLQGFYRGRLIRAYLGASNSDPRLDPFTGLGHNDDLPLASLVAARPFPVVNMTLNLVEKPRLAWQQRKAAIFTASPLHCGSPLLGYRPSAGYGGRGGITLGTAIATSGAAASPNMGYHSSPLVGFIMTLFNLRLGAWLGNPGPAGERTWRRAGPRSAFDGLAREALGRTGDSTPYVYLSDGGHFETLGLYAMVARRCQTILVVDADCDPGFSYADLGNAVRKIRIDMSIPIDFTEPVETQRERKRRWAVARIGYSAVAPAAPDGVLIYLKPMRLGTEPPDVQSYACAHPAFPHETTLDQWFAEAQTESYRMLGLATVAALCAEMPTLGEYLGALPLSGRVADVAGSSTG